MGRSDLDPGARERRPWKPGTLLGAKRPLKPRDVWAIRFFLDEHRRRRDRALFDLAIDSRLRGCDIVTMRISDLVVAGDIRNRATITQQKTGRPVQFKLMADARASLLVWLERRGGSKNDFAFPSQTDYLGHLSTRQYARLVDEWVTAIGLNVHEYGTHSLRRTKASLIYKSTNLQASLIMPIPGVAQTSLYRFRASPSTC
jgi:integrase